MPACQECYRVKVRCDRDDNGEPSKSTGCSRCRRLGILCVARPSRQGQGPKKRRRHEKQQHDNSKELVVSSSEDAKVLHEIMSSKTTPSSSSFSSSVPLQFHYGIRYLITSWTSFALARRSFALLGRACHLAVKCHVPMEDVLGPTRKHVLLPLLFLEQQQEQQPTETAGALQWDALPMALRALCELDDHSSTTSSNRYIMIREAKNGQSRYLASNKFQTDICSVWLMEQTWKANEQPVVQLFLHGQADFDKFTKAIYYQTSRYTHPEKAPECVRMNSLQVTFSNPAPHTKEMDLVYAFEIVTLDHSFYVCEFVSPKKKEHHVAITSAVPQQEQEQQSRIAKAKEDKDGRTLEPTSDDSLRLFDDLSPLDELEDPDFEAFLELLND